MPRRAEQGFVWIPRQKNTKYSIEIDGVDVTNDCISSEWTRAIIGLECPAKLMLVDTDGAYVDQYTGGEVIELKLDFGDGTTSQWKGTLDEPKRKFGDGYLLELVASHYQSGLLDVTVTAEYIGDKTADAVYKELVDEYLTGHTYVNVAASATLITIKWDNKPLWDCILDLCGLASFDAYVDSDKDHHFFAQGSIENETDAIVWADNLLSIESFGTDTIDVKNRIIVYGEDNAGLSVIYQVDDTDSQTTYGVKEKIIKDTSINTYAQAKVIGDTELATIKDTANKGEFLSIILPDINPGDKIWITNPPQKINGQFRIVKYVHRLPEETTKTIVAKEENIPTIFKERKKSELQLQKITNPNKMTNSVNLVFDDSSDFDAALSSGIEVSAGNLKIVDDTEGETGTMVSVVRTATTDITYVELRVVGDAIAGTTYYISTDNGDTYTLMLLDTLTPVVAGVSLRLKVVLNSYSTLIDSVAVLYK